MFSRADMDCTILVSTAYLIKLSQVDDSLTPPSETSKEESLDCYICRTTVIRVSGTAVTAHFTVGLYMNIHNLGEVLEVDGLRGDSIEDNECFRRDFIEIFVCFVLFDIFSSNSTAMAVSGQYTIHSSLWKIRSNRKVWLRFMTSVT